MLDERKSVIKFWIAVIVSIFALGSWMQTVRAEEPDQVSAGTVYYVDSETGNDENSGTGEQEAWKTLEKVNATTFSPGDEIRFKAGCTWQGQLNPKGSGSAEAPIRIDMYGEGDKPIIDGAGRYSEIVTAETEAYELNNGAAVLLFNQDYWEISNLHVTNKAEDKQSRFGILVRWHNYGTGQHVYIQDCDIENISGRYIDSWDVYNDNARFQGDGILVISTGTVGGTQTNYNDILIEGNTLNEIYRTGITIWSQWTARNGSAQYWQSEGEKYSFHTTVGDYKASTNVRICHNELKSIAGDGVLINTSYGAVVEYNNVRECNKYSVDPNAGIWPHNSDNTLIQYNSVYDTYNTADGQAFDIDYNCDGTIIQYNYTNNNTGGFLLVMESATNSTIRYNISIDDHCAIFDMRSYGDVKTYNNFFYMTSGLQRNVGLRNSWLFANNIFYAPEEMSINNGAAKFESNCYMNIKASYFDDTAVEKNPQFTDLQGILDNPQSVDFNNKSLEENLTIIRQYLSLTETSPCINSGVSIENNGGQDILGSKLDDVSDIGPIDSLTQGESVNINVNTNYALDGTVNVVEGGSVEDWGWAASYLVDGDKTGSSTNGYHTSINGNTSDMRHTLEISLTEKAPVNRIDIYWGWAPVDFTLSIWDENTGTWKQVAAETDYDNAGTAETVSYRFDNTVETDKIQLDITMMEASKAYTQIKELEAYVFDTSEFEAALTQAEKAAEKVDVLQSIVEEYRTYFDNLTPAVKQREINEKTEELNNLIQKYTECPELGELLKKINEVQEKLDTYCNWPAVSEILETSITEAKALYESDSPTSEAVNNAISNLDVAVEEYMKAIEEHTPVSVNDDFSDGWNNVFFRNEELYIDSAGSNAESYGWNFGALVYPESNLYPDKNYGIIYKVNDIQDFEVRVTRFKDYTSDTDYVRFYVSSDGKEYEEVTNCDRADSETGGCAHRVYSCTDVPENVQYLKIEFAQGYSWQFNVNNVKITGTELSETDPDVSSADKTELKELLDKLQGIETEKYTDESVAVFQEALKNAQSVMEDETLSEAEQETVDQAITRLKEAFDGLELAANSTDNEESSDNSDSETNSADKTGDEINSVQSGKESETETNIAQTGDTTQILYPGIVLIVSFTAIMTVLIMRRRASK